MAWGFSYNGIHSTSKGIRIAYVEGRGILPEVESRTAETLSKHGMHYFGHKYRGRIIRVEIVINEQSLSNFRAKIRDLAAWLNPAAGPKELIFDDETDKKYYAVISGGTDFEGLFFKKTTEIEFLCPDPFAYSTTESTANFTADTVTINNTGTAESFPIFTINFFDTATELKIEKDPNTFIRIVRNFVAGDEVEINCEAGTITLNGVTNLIAALDIDSDIFSLGPGNAVLNISPVGVSSASLVFVRRWI